MCPPDRGNSTTKGNRWLGEMLTECAWAAAAAATPPCRRSTGGWPDASASRKTAIAVGHSILVIAWHLLANDGDYAELGGDYFARRDADRARQRAVAQLQALGYHVTLQPLAARHGRILLSG